MKRIVVFESVSAESEWTKFLIRVDPHPNDICFARDLTEAKTQRYIARGVKQVRDLVCEMPLDVATWKRSMVTHEVTYGDEGRRDWRTRVILTLEDLGRCIVGKIVMNGELRTVLILFPSRRQEIVDENVLNRIAALVPEHVREKVAVKLEADGLRSHGDVAFSFMPRKTCKPERPGLRDFEFLLMRAGSRWAEWRDVASKVFANSNVA